MSETASRFLVDVNLPKYVSFFNLSDFIHIVDINTSYSDAEIWSYALDNKLVILTKDADFYYRSHIIKKRPKVVFFKLSNQTLKDLYSYFFEHWDNIIKALNRGDLIIALPNGIEIVV